MNPAGDSITVATDNRASPPARQQAVDVRGRFELAGMRPSWTRVTAATETCGSHSSALSSTDCHLSGRADWSPGRVRFSDLSCSAGLV